MRGVHNAIAKKECIRLRTINKLSYNQIKNRTGISVATLSSWLRKYPLSKDRLQELKNRTLRYSSSRRKTLPAIREPCIKIHGVLNSSRKMKISETAILIRLLYLNLHVFASPFDGERYDWVVETPSKKFARLQVKTCRAGKYGQPFASLTKAVGHSIRKRYDDDDFDFIIGYDILSDTAYVWTKEDVKNNGAAISLSEFSKENWKPLLDF